MEKKSVLAIKNSFSAILLTALTMMLIAGCASKTKSPVRPGKAPPTGVSTEPLPVETPVDDSSEDMQEPPPESTVVPEPVPVKVIPKIGLIFSGGGAKAWAHVGVIKEIEKSKWPVYAVAGFEWGAVVGAVYAHNLSANEVEWELSKVRGFDDPAATAETIFGKIGVNELKVPFVCSSLNVAKQMIYLLNRGQLEKLMPFCLAHPPLSRAYSQSVAEMDDIAALARHLRSTGANKIVLINVLAQKTKRSFTPDYLSPENMLWVKSAAAMARKIEGVDDTVQIYLDDYGLMDLARRREIIAKGGELGYTEIRKLTAKYGL